MQCTITSLLYKTRRKNSLVHKGLNMCVQLTSGTTGQKKPLSDFLFYVALTRMHLCAGLSEPSTPLDKSFQIKVGQWKIIFLISQL